MTDNYLTEGTIVYHKLNNIEIVVLGSVSHSGNQQFRGRYRENNEFKMDEFYYSEVRRRKKMTKLEQILQKLDEIIQLLEKKETTSKQCISQS